MLGQTLQAYDKVNHIKYQLQNLTLSMLKLGGKPPEVRGKAMQLICLVDFVLLLAGAMHKVKQSTHTRIVHLLLQILHQIYHCMGTLTKHAI